MKNKRSKKELTRLILTALILGGGILYGPVAEADDPIVYTGEPGAIDSATGNKLHYEDNKVFAFDNYTWKLNYSGTATNWSTVSAYGAHNGRGGGEFTLINGTIQTAFGNYKESGIVSGGKVNINGGNIRNGWVYGGMSNSDADGNTVRITGGTIGPSGDEHAGIYGGYSSGGDAKNNAVIISGGTFTKDDDGNTVAVFGGRSTGTDNEATGNSVTIDASAVYLTNLFGGYVSYSGYQDAYWGGNNTLYLGANAKNATVKYKVAGFDTIALTSDFAFENGKNVLSAQKLQGGTHNTVFDIHEATNLLGDTNISHYGTMTILSSTGTGDDAMSMSGIKLHYNNVSGDIKAYTSKEVASSSITNDIASTTVRLDGTRTHTVANNGSTITYTIANNISTVTFGDVTWGTTPRTLTLNQYTFGSGTTIDQTNLEFTNPEAVTGSMTLLANATGITGDNIAHSQGYTKTANGTSLGMTLAGNITRGSDAIGYTATGNTVNSINLTGWTGSTYAMGTGWASGLTTDSITAEGFTEPDENTDIFTTNTPNFFNDDYITGSKKYQGDTTTLVDDTAKGVTLTGYKGGGVKATDSGKKLSYFKEMMDTQSITLGEMTWGDGRTAASGYNFANIGDNEIDATDLTFTNPAAATGSMDLLSGATDLAAGLTVVGADHSQNFTGSAAANGATFDGTITGTVATAAKKITYTVGSKNITGIDLAGWNGTSTALEGWTASTSGVAVKAEGFTAPTLTAGTETNIFTTSAANFFSDTNITGAQKYGASTAPSSDTVNGVTFTGSQEKGVKASTNGQNLVYAVGNMAVSNIALGNMAVGNTGVVTPRTADANYTFNGSTTIDATNLTFDKPAEVENSTLVSGATNVSSTNPITGAAHSQAITNAAIGNGITGSGTLTGTVSASAGTISYTVGGKSLSSMNLSGWNGTTTSLPAGWTGSNVAVTTGSFVVPNGDTVIFNGGTAGFFGTVTGERAYKDGVKVTEAAKNGVALTGTKNGGVKAIDNGATLKYFTETMNANAITLGKMTWGTGRAITESGYTFDGVGNNGVDATSLTFAFAGDTVNTIASGDDWDLVTGASGLAAGLTVKGSPVSQQVSYGISNVASLTGTLTGKVTTNTNAVHYAVTGKTLDSVDISKWNGETTDTAVNASWSKNAGGIAVTGSGFKTPTAVGKYNILTAGSTGFFTGAKIDSSIAYQPSGTYSETAQNITLSGKQAKGVLANSNGTALQYKIGTAYIDTIKLGTVSYSKDAVLLDKSGALYNFSNVTGLDKSGFSVTMTDDQKKTAKAADSMTLVKANGTLHNIAAQEMGKSSYSYTAAAGLTVKGALTGSVAATAGNVLYTVNSNKASDLTVSTVGWNSTYARPDSEIAYSDAIVNAENVTFSGVSTLNKGDTMTLVSNFGTSVNRVKGGIFTLDNGKTGKGHAYWDSATGSLVYVVDRGADETVETKMPSAIRPR